MRFAPEYTLEERTQEVVRILGLIITDARGDFANELAILTGCEGDGLMIVEITKSAHLRKVNRLGEHEPILVRGRTVLSCRGIFFTDTRSGPETIEVNHDYRFSRALVKQLLSTC